MLTELWLTMKRVSFWVFDVELMVTVILIHAGFLFPPGTLIVSDTTHISIFFSFFFLTSAPFNLLLYVVAINCSYAFRWMSYCRPVRQEQNLCIYWQQEKNPHTYAINKSGSVIQVTAVWSSPIHTSKKTALHSIQYCGYTDLKFAYYLCWQTITERLCLLFIFIPWSGFWNYQPKWKCIFMTGLCAIH